MIWHVCCFKLTRVWSLIAFPAISLPCQFCGPGWCVPKVMTPSASPSEVKHGIWSLPKHGRSVEDMEVHQKRNSTRTLCWYNVQNNCTKKGLYQNGVMLQQPLLCQAMAAAFYPCPWKRTRQHLARTVPWSLFSPTSREICLNRKSWNKLMHYFGGLNISVAIPRYTF